MRWLSPFLIILSGADAVSLIAQDKPVIRAPLMKAAPLIDGALGAGEWAEAAALAGLVSGDGFVADRGARAWIGLTQDNVYVAMESDMPPQGDILARVSERPRDETATLYSDDVAEFWLSPISKDAESSPVSFRLATNALGSLYLSRHDPRADQGFGAWAVTPMIAQGRRDRKWVTELAIPLKALGVDFEKLAGMRFRVARNWKQPAETASTEGWGNASFSNADSMSVLVLDQAAPCVQEVSLGDWIDGKLDWQYRLKNTSSEPQELRVNLDIASNSSMPPKTLEKLIPLKPGEEASVDLVADLFPEVICQAVAKVSSADGKVVYLARSFQLDTRQRKQIWQLEEQGKAQKAEFFIAYSPSKDKLAFKLTGPDVNGDGTTVHCEVKESINDRVVAEKTFAKLIRSADGKAVFGELDLPKLIQGRYEVICKTLSQGKERRSTQSFERNIYPWEQTPLGKGNAVPYGFKALTTDRATVKAALSESQMAASGLPEQIMADGVPLLAGPIKVRGVVGGQSIAAQGTNLELAAVSAEEAQGRGGWTLGEISGETVLKAEVDGFTYYTLKVAPSSSKISSLEIEIPLLEKETPLFHAVGAGVRGNFAGKTPAGQGEVWSNLQAVAYGYPDNFIPYVWLGGIRRGLAFVADSSTGWVIGQDESSLRVVRDGDTVRLIARVVSRPHSLKNGLEVTFGLQATPVKNRPANWRLYDFVDQFPGVTAIRYLGSCPYWGGISAFGDFYPRDYDYSIFKEQQKASQEKRVTPQMQQFIAEWNKGNADFINAVGLDDHVERGFARASVADYVVPYTDAREIRESTPEFRTFQDEWVRRGFNSRDWSDNNVECVTTEAVPSFQDFALWHFQKMRDIGSLRGIYFDNDFPIIQKNPFFEYSVAADGESPPKPSTGIYDVRDYFKRAYKLFSEGGAMPLNTVHMTNSALAPHLSFATVNLDWEFKYGASDFQDRFSQDYIFASTMGEQFGTIPLVLNCIFPTEGKSLNWLTRSLIGTTFIYEVKIYGSSQLDRVLYRKIFNIIYGFGYGTEGCEVFRFWEDPPFQVSGSNQRAILLKNGSRLLLMVTDFGTGGKCEVKIDSRVLSGSFEVTDAETGETVAVSGNSIKFSLDRHQFKLLLIDLAAS